MCPRALLAQETLATEAYVSLSQAVFEVVVPKLDAKDTFSYAETLPVELLPFAERTDPYNSIGTAFCVGENRFVSAAHVFALEEESLNQSFFIRDSAGTVYPVDQVYTYTNFQDCVVFSVKDGPTVKPLPTLEKPELNTRVFTVGNAYGQGIIVRDGLLTSTTPEERNGEWRWLRFSAAASPGNSGGPLVDAKGRVMGIAIARSENENFNLALPLSVVESLPANVARLNKQLKYGISLINYTVVDTEDVSVNLPLPIGELKRILVNARNDFNKKMLAKLLSDRADKTFPKGEGSEYLLRNSMNSYMPGIATEQSDYSWKLEYPKDSYSATLPEQSRLEWGDWKGYTIQRYVHAGKTPLTELYDDPEKAMTRLLTGYSLSRSMAGKSIRLTSLGKPASNARFSDRYGRTWFATRWDIVFADRAILWFRLPTPDGFVGIYRVLPQWDAQAYVNDVTEIVNYLDVDYMGTVEQWVAFLGQEGIVPPALRDVRYTLHDNGKASVEGLEFSIGINPGIFRVTGSTMLYCGLSWTRNAAGDPVRNVNSVYFKNSGSEAGGMGIARIMRPEGGDSEEARNQWKGMTGNNAPFDGKPYHSGGKTYAATTLSVQPFVPEPTGADGLKAVYLVQLSNDSEIAIDEARSDFSGLLSSASCTPLGVQVATGIPPERQKKPEVLKKIDDMTIFEAIAAGNAETLARFADGKTDLEARNATGETPLLAALSGGKAELASILMQAKAKTDVVDQSGVTALMAALRNAPESLAISLIGSGENINAADKEGTTALMIALLKAKKDAAKRLVQAGADVNQADSEGWTAFMYASRYADEALANLIIEKGANVNAVDKDNWSCLAFAARYGTEKTCDLLLKKGANVNTVTSAGWTALMLALRNEKPKTAKALIDRDADLSPVTSDGWTALMHAACYSTPQLTKLLIDKNADFRAVNKDGWSALMFALRYEKPEAARALIAKGADLSVVNENNWTLLMFALRYSLTDIAQSLIDKGAPITGVNSDGWTTLMFALRYGKPELAKRLLEGGCDVAQRSSDGYTALHFAADHASVDVVQALLDAGANPGEKTLSGKTPLSIAQEMKKTATVKLLTERGGDGTAR